MKPDDRPSSPLPAVQLLAAAIKGPMAERRDGSWAREKHQRGLSQAGAAICRKFSDSADQLGAEHVRGWIDWLQRTQRLSPATVNIAIAALRHLFAAVNRPEVMDGIRTLRLRKAPSDVLSESDVQRLLMAATNAKHRAMLALLGAPAPQLRKVAVRRLSVSAAMFWNSTGSLKSAYMQSPSVKYR
jgi:site-specific recombinase XerD